MKKEPFLQVSKRRNKARWQERLLIRFIALILALIVCGAVIVALVKMNPVDVYKAIWDGAMGSDRRLWQTIRDTMVLLCISIGLAPAFNNRSKNSLTSIGTPLKKSLFCIKQYNIKCFYLF